MYDGATVGVVVPAYNEERFVADVIESVPAFVDAVYAVDDCSTDGTWAEIRACVGRDAPEAGVAAADGREATVADGSGLAFAGSEPELDDRVVPIRHRVNRGRGAAVKTGYRAAVTDDVDVVAVMDADGQMDPDVLDRIVDPIVNGEADYTKGNRLVDRAHCREMSGFRLFGNLLLTGLTRVASGHWGMRDPQNGYTAISSEALERLTVDEFYDGYGFLNDVLVRLGAHDLRAVDVPMRAIYGDESSGIGYRSFVPQLSLLLLRGFLWRLWTTHAGGNRSHG